MEVVPTLLLIAATPAAVVAAILWLPRLVLRALERVTARAENRRRGGLPLPSGPPLEHICADLRRLMAEHERVSRSPDVASRASRLRALEGALTDCAFDAARALEVVTPPRPDRAPLPRALLRDLLHDLATHGVVLPSLERFGR